MEPVHVLITGAAGQIGYVLAFRIANGDLLGDKKVCLHLLEITPAMTALSGVVMELQDCAFPNLVGVVATDKVEEAFKDVDIAFLVGSFPRKDGMNRSDLLAKNGGIFQVQGAALSNYAKPSVKVLVVGNPANTNCLIALHYATKLGPKNFCAMTRLDHNRMCGEVAARLHTTADKVHGPIVWGNHSNTQVPDCTHATVETEQGVKKVTDLLPLDALQGEFATKIQGRGGAVIKARGASSAASAANAAITHMRSWVHGTKPGEYVSMAIPVPANKPYGIKEGVVYSFPCTVDAQGIHVVENLEISPYVHEKMVASETELIQEKETAYQVLHIE